MSVRWSVLLLLLLLGRDAERERVAALRAGEVLGGDGVVMRGAGGYGLCIMWVRPLFVFVSFPLACPCGVWLSTRSDPCILSLQMFPALRCLHSQRGVKHARRSLASASLLSTSFACGNPTVSCLYRWSPSSGRAPSFRHTFRRRRRELPSISPATRPWSS